MNIGNANVRERHRATPHTAPAPQTTFWAPRARLRERARSVTHTAVFDRAHRHARVFHGQSKEWNRLRDFSNAKMSFTNTLRILEVLGATYYRSTTCTTLKLHPGRVTRTRPPLSSAWVVFTWRGRGATSSTTSLSFFSGRLTYSWAFPR